MKLTIFTPTYNRSKLLERLYKSLVKQTDIDFEWLIVDDGSTDDTESLIKNWSASPFKLNYIKTKNRGKHIAINIGAAKASGDWFFIVDSDDYLLPKAVETLKALQKQTPDTEDFAGFCTNVIYEDGSQNGNLVKYDVLDTDFITYSNYYHYTGEKPSCLKTSIWKEFPFPEYEDEKFCSEALVLRRMAKKYKVRFFNKSIYVMEGYLDDGLTHSLKKHFLNSPSYSTLLFKEQIVLPYTSFKFKIGTLYNYWKYYRSVPCKTNELRPNLFLRCIGFPVYLTASLAMRILRK